MATQFNYLLTPEEYLKIERQAEYKSEYADGVVYAMAGGSEAHNLIAGNALTELNLQLRETRCKVYPSDMKVYAPNDNRFYYPDVSVVCEDTRFVDDHKDVILNPILIIEVLSESTAAYDRGKKFQAYQQIESLREYVLVAQDEAVIEKYGRQGNRDWLYTKITGIDQYVELSSVSCRILLRSIYAKVL